MYPSFVDKTFNKVLDISSEEYHERNDCVHSSSLKNIIKSPHAYKFFIENPIKETPSMRIGTIAHGAILEGQDFLKKYVVQPVFKGFTKDGKETTSLASHDIKEQIAEWKSSLPVGAKIMTQGEHDKLMFMLDSLLNHKFVFELLKDGIPEYKKQWHDPATGLACISSDDFVSFKNDVWIDIKTTTSCEWEHFRRNGVERLNYPFQAAFYARGHKEVHNKDFRDKLWIAIENQAPYNCRVHYVDPFYMEVGEKEVRSAMRDLKLSITHDQWEQSQNIIEVGEPSFNYKEKFDKILNKEI